MSNKLQIILAFSFVLLLGSCARRPSSLGESQESTPETSSSDEDAGEPVTLGTVKLEGPGGV